MKSLIINLVEDIFNFNYLNIILLYVNMYRCNVKKRILFQQVILKLKVSHTKVGCEVLLFSSFGCQKVLPQVVTLGHIEIVCYKFGANLVVLYDFEFKKLETVVSYYQACICNIFSKSQVNVKKLYLKPIIFYVLYKITFLNCLLINNMRIEFEEFKFLWTKNKC